jgi:MFS family permease
MIGSRLLFFGTFSLIGLLTLFLPLYNNYTMYFIYMTCFGLYTGGVWVLMSMIIIELVGVSQLASAFGMVMLVAGFGQLVVPFIGGKICS